MSQKQYQNQTHKDLNTLISMAQTGYFPLFSKEWIDDSLSNQDYYLKINMVRAKKNILGTLKKLSRHSNFDRKKMALLQLTKKERTVFIQSFFKIIEYKTLEKIKDLH